MDYIKGLIEINKELRYKILSSNKFKEDIGEIIFNLNCRENPLEITYFDNNILIISNELFEIRINTVSGQLFYKTKQDR